MQSVIEYANIHNVSKVTVYKWIDEGAIKVDEEGKIFEGQPRPKPKKRGKGKAPSKRKVKEKLFGVVNQLDMRFKYIKSFSSIKEASEELGCASSAISRACNNVTRSAYGFRWEREINEKARKKNK